MLLTYGHVHGYVDGIMLLTYGHVHGYVAGIMLLTYGHVHGYVDGIMLLTYGHVHGYVCYDPITLRHCRSLHLCRPVQSLDGILTFGDPLVRSCDPKTRTMP